MACRANQPYSKQNSFDQSDFLAKQVDTIKFPPVIATEKLLLSHLIAPIMLSCLMYHKIPKFPMPANPLAQATPEHLNFLKNSPGMLAVYMVKCPTS